MRGTFNPSPLAANLTTATHFTSSSPIPITARFSSSTGLPHISDTDPSANPRGFAVRFHLGDRKHTDIISHSTPYFPVRTGAELLEVLQAQVASGTADSSPSPIEKFLSTHPETVAFIQAPKPFPTSFGRESYYGVNAFRFVNGAGIEKFGRYRIVPVDGEEFVSEAELKEKTPTYLFDELRANLQKAAIEFKLLVQIAKDDDKVDDATVHWPEDREVMDLGVIRLDTFVEDNESLVEQKRIIFDPIPRVKGIEPSEDPLLDLRAAAYLISGRQRRATEYKD